VGHIFLALLLYSQVAADPNAGWARVQRLNAGTKITLTYLDGTTEERVVEGASQSQLMLRTRGGRVTTEMILRDTIVEIAIERRRRKPAGAIIGGVGGFLWGISLAGLQCTTGGCAFAVGLIDGIVGGLVGHALSPVHVTFEVIYHANP
jgi:hypothetical protein